MSDLEQLNNPIAEAYWRALIAKEIMDADLSEAKEISSDYYAATLRTQMVCSAIAKGKK
jgi:hypothetical protein